MRLAAELIGKHCLLLCLVLWLQPAAALQLFQYPLEHGLKSLIEQQGHILVEDQQGQIFAVALSRQGLTLKRSEIPIETPGLPSQDSLPDTEISKGRNNIQQAWLIKPTDRYQHGVLGDAIEAGGFRVITKQGEMFEYILPETSVFEDRKVRLADLDNDGNDELLLVRSYLDQGAALAVFTTQQQHIQLMVETPPIGIQNR